MRVGVVTLFPELFETFSRVSLVGKAVASGKLAMEFEDLRRHGLGKHLCVDDTPYGGGAGMVFRVDCVVAAIEALQARMAASASAQGEPIERSRPPRRVLLCPQGQPFTQQTAARWAAEEELVLVCGRYEGFDDRVREFVDEEASLGDFVVIGGEIPAMAMIESCARLLPGVLGNDESALDESFADPENRRLEYPQYTRPTEFRGLVVPEILRGGNHGAIKVWRDDQAKQRTFLRRPELVAGPAGPPAHPKGDDPCGA